MKVTKQDLLNYQAMLDDLPRVLTEARKDSDITQEKLAEELGISPDRISLDERGGYTHAQIDRLKKIVNALIKLKT